MRVAVCLSNIAIVLNKGLFSKYLNRFLTQYNWSARFAEYLDKYNIDYDYVYIDRHDWIEKIDRFDVILWKPAFMGIRSSQRLKEKVFFMQYIMRKRVYPNYDTIWHFDSKIAQSYLFRYKKIKTPDTFVSFDYYDVMKKISEGSYPLVLKGSSGAGGSSVRLVQTPKKMNRVIKRKFVYECILARLINSCLPNLFDRFGEVYLQGFLPGNNSDLRITIIGGKFAFGFWRNNRKNDFRASGSGKIDYDRAIPIDIIKYCSQISKDNNFDSMAYDLLFRDGDFLVSEMSYGYMDSAIYGAKGYYMLCSNGDVKEFVKGNYWPQELWVKLIKEKQEIDSLQ